MENKKLTSVFKSRRFKYGSLAITLTVLLIALIIIFNAAVYAITYSFGWYLDLTGEQYYGITDASTVLLDSVLTGNVQIKVIFCQEKDLLLDNDQGFYIYKCIESYQKKYPDNIKIEFFDINKHPELAGEYTTQHGISLRTYNIIMETNVSKNVRVLDYDNFFTYDSESQTVYAFNGEARFTSYIISLCDEMPKCYFIEGHGESITDGKGNKNALWEMLTDVGFDNQVIDLRTGARLDDAKLIVINAPVSDFSTDELEEIGRFMDDLGNALVFLSPESMVTTDAGKELTNLKSFLRDWGVEVAGMISDDTHSLTNSGGFAVIADYPVPSEGDFAASLHSYMREQDSQPYTVINNALAFTCPWEGDANGTKSRSYDPVLYSYNTAKLGTKAGQYEIASLIRRTKYVEEQTLSSYMFVSSAGYVDEEYINSSVYGNRDIIYMLADQMGKKLVPLGIDMKAFESEAITIATAEAYFWTVMLTGVLPLAVIVVGTVICYRRKRS